MENYFSRFSSEKLKLAYQGYRKMAETGAVGEEDFGGVFRTAIDDMNKATASYGIINATNDLLAEIAQRWYTDKTVESACGKETVQPQPTTYGNLAKMLQSGAVYVEFTDMDSVSFDGPDNGMRARLRNIINSEENSPEYPPELHVFFDFSDFKEYNQDKALPIWYDKKGEASLTWFQTEEYPYNGHVDFYISGTLDDEATVFKHVVLGCECCAGDEAVAEENGVLVFIDGNGKMDVFVDDSSVEPIATAHVKRCPNCGRQFSQK